MNSGINFTAICLADGFGALLAVIMLGVRIWNKEGREKETKLLRSMLWSVLICCFADIVSFAFDGIPGTGARIAVYAGSLILFLANMIIGTLWMVLLITHVFEGRISKWQKALIFILDSVGLAVIIVNFFVPVVFSVSPENVYSRGPLYWLYMAIGAVFCIDGVISYCIARKSRKVISFPVWHFIIPVFAGIVLQSVVYGISTIWPAISIAITCMMFSLYAKEINDQRARLLGAVPLSSELLDNSDIGMWAFELDEFKPTRMYADNAVLRMTGLDPDSTPETTYHKWFERIDKSSVAFVSDALEKMKSGEHAEVRFPWHSPSGKTLVFRFGGVRNPVYTRGVRIEGTLHNVTEMLQFDEEEAERHRQTEIQLRHEQLRREVLDYMINEDDDPIELLKNFAERIRVLIDCDQVIYRDLEETRIMVNSTAIEKTWSVPIEYCMQCEHFDAHHPMYSGGYTEMDNCQEGWQGIPVYSDCPIKSSLTRIVYCNGEIAGYLAIHYVQNYHHFTDLERSTLEEFTRILSMSLSRYAATSENRELKRIAEMQEQLKESSEIIGGLASEYLALYYLNIGEGTFRVITLDGQKLPDTKQLVSGETDGFALIKQFGSSEAVHPDDRQLFSGLTVESVRERLNHSKSFSVRFRRNYGGEYLWSEMDVVKYEAADEQANVIAIGFAERDKEIRREQEQQRQLADALEMAESASKAKTTFLFNMSHDIRTPMNAILGYTDMAIRHIDDGDTAMDCLQKIKSSGGHLLDLINDILEMSRIEAGKLELTPEPLDLRDAIAKTQHMSQALAIPKSIAFKVSVGEISDPYVYADELHFNEVLINIISNAMKYSNEDGTVSYSVSQISGVTDGTARYRFVIEDDGIGMSEDFLTHIYETFAREKSATVSKLEGTGLGLSIVKRIVDLSGGTIDIKSRSGEGTTVTVEMPFRVMNADEIAAFKESAVVTPDIYGQTSLAGRKVLLVEDNEMNREIATELLTDGGLVIDSAEDGDIAVKMIEEKGVSYYDCILMDIQMPVMNGYEATAAIRSMPDGERIPIIALSANAFEEDRRKSIDAGMNAHIAKPIDITALFDTMQSLACNS